MTLVENNINIANKDEKISLTLPGAGQLKADSS